MAVGELIKHLKKLDKNLIVSRSGYEGGYTDGIDEPYITELCLNVNSEWYYGEHESKPFSDTDKHTTGKRVIIG